MPTLKLEDADYAERIRGSLGSSLVQLMRIDGPSVPQPQRAEIPGFDEWQEQWRSNSRLITQRLELIDAELERLSQTAVSPQLNVFQDADAVH